MTISAKSPLGSTLKIFALIAGGLLVVTPLAAQTVVWSGFDATNNINTNWSDVNNWSGGTPGPATNIYFFDAGANGIQGIVNNLVDANTRILSLQYGNTNGFHTTQIKSGLTLTVSNNAASNLVFAGTGTDNGASQTLYSMLTGSGSFAVVSTNTGSFFAVQQGSANNGNHMASLDLSGLANFNLTAGRLMIGSANPGAGGYNWLSGTLYLAGTNTIRVNGTAPAIDAGDCTSNGGTNYVYLGQTNSIFADSITIAHSKATCTLSFNPALTGSNPTLFLNGNTNARVSALAIGDFSAQTGSASTTSGTMNLTGGTVNVQVDTCYVSRGQTGAGTGTTTGTLRLGAGIFNVNTLDVAYVSVNTAVGSVTGTLTITNGTIVINNNLVLGYNSGATATATGTFNTTNGTVLANNIIAGGGTSKINMSGGFLAVSNTIGSLTAPLSSLTVNNGATLQLWVANNRTNAAISTVSSDNSGVINIGAMPIVLNYPSSYPLIFSPSGGANGIRFSLGTLPGAYLGYISNDNSSTIWLVITNGPPLPKTDLWSGGMNNNWDTNTLNWASNSVAVTYRELDLVVFNDSAQTNTVNLVGPTPHTPYSWIVTNNILNYTFTGTNSVGGSTSLVKSGGAALTLSENGDSFSGGITVNSGTVILDEASNTVAGGLTIAGSAITQIGSNDNKGGLPSGSVVNNGSLVFSQTITDLVSTAISGGGSLTQQGTGRLILSGTNSYTGNTVVLQGTLALTGGGSISSSLNVIVNNSTLDVSGVTGTVTLANLNMTNASIKTGVATLNVSGLDLGGSSNTIKVVTLPPTLFYPTNVTLIQSATGINGYNFVLGSLPAGSPSYAGSLGTNGNAVGLALTSGPLSVVAANVSFSSTNAGLVLNPAFCGLSYEKSSLTGHLFASNDVSLVSMFGQIAPAVLRVGGNSVDTTCWGGLSNKTPITAAQVDAFAGFVKALPTNWHVIYGINMSVNNATNCAAEAAYAANALGSSLLGFEIGNECDLYAGNGIRATTYTYAQFLLEWQALAGAITNAVPGWAITNAGNGWTLTGPASAYNTSVYTVPFAKSETGIVSMVTQHYYRANGQSPTSTLQLLLQPDTSLPGTVSTLATAATAAKLPYGFRMAECGSFYNGGAPNVSDAYGTALWTLDFMFTIALNGGQGVNFHGGGSGPGYTPIADNGTAVIQARPEFYGLKIFSLVSQGNVIPAVVSLASNINFTAYGVRRASGGISAVLLNKETNDYVQVSINLETNVGAAQLLELNGLALDSTNGYTLGGATINADGSWAGGVQSVIAATNGQLTLIMPPISAVLLNPMVTEVTNYLLANDALNSSSWNGATNWSDGLSPHSVANYFTLTNLLRSPISGSSLTFAGDSLTIGPSVPGNTSFRFKLNPPGGSYTINNCTNAGGIIDAGISNATNYLSGTNWFISAPSGFGLAGDNTRAIILTNLNLSGSFTLSNGVANPANGLGTIVYAGNATHFTGPIVTSLGTTLQAYSQTNLGGNPASLNPAQFVLDNGIFQPLASMALSNANSGVTINSGGGTFNVGSGFTLTIANPIAGTGGLTNQGGGFLIFSGTNTYTGPTTINTGTLALKGGASISSSTSVIVSGGGTFDVSGLNSTFILAASQTLSNSAVNAFISGTNKTGSGTVSLIYDGVNPSFIITNGGMVLSNATLFAVNNIGTQLGAGGNYKIIAKATTGNAGLVAGTVPASVSVGGNGAAGPAALQIMGGELYLNVALSLPRSGTNLMFSMSAHQLTLSWPTNYTGWLLQSNSVNLASTNDWFTVPGSASTNRIQINLTPTQTNVFYRMVHP
jgi:autotransporter-associated beta strand protein